MKAWHNTFYISLHLHYIINQLEIVIGPVYMTAYLCNHVTR